MKPTSDYFKMKFIKWHYKKKGKNVDPMAFFLSLHGTQDNKDDLIHDWSSNWSWGKVIEKVTGKKEAKKKS